jgi:CTP:molybdopterin cytidylyltransferase MocA
MIAAIVLAAGAASRYGRPKQRELLPAVLDALAQADVGEVVVVAGAHELTVENRPGVRLVQASDWERGPGASLRRGLESLGRDVSHALVVLADGPSLDARAVARLLDARDRGAVVAASYEGTRSHPVVLARTVWTSVPDDGGRALDAVLVDCSDLRAPGDVDYPGGDAT